MQKINNIKTLLCLGFFLPVLMLTEQVNAQIYSLGLGESGAILTQACAKDDFKTFYINITFSNDLASSATNQFSIELSNPDGSFPTPPNIISISDPGAVNVSPANLSFDLPTTAAGENYRVRVRSSHPTVYLRSSPSFPAYYKLHTTAFTINNFVANGVYCSGGIYELKIDDPGTGENITPLQFPSLTFTWYREGTNAPVGFGSSINVNQEGVYYVETDYGSCTENSGSSSNRVTITEATSGITEAEIASSLGNPFCPDQNDTILSTITGNSYQWYLYDAPIQGATNQMYETSESGIYSVQVDLGTCQALGEIVLNSELFNSSINVPDVSAIQDGDTLEVTVTDNAIAPQYEWHLNNNIIAGANQNTYTATEFGDYKVIVTEAAGSCTGSSEILFVINEELNLFPEIENIPNLISPNGDTVNDTWIIPKKYVSGTNTEVIIMSNKGEVVYQTNEYLNNWPEDEMNLTSVNLVYYYIIKTEDQQTKKGSITIVK